MNLFLADLILVTHALFVAFVMLGLIAIVPGKYWHWSWIRNRRFRLIHLLAVGIVMLEAWLGLVCPLTEWENQFREAAGGSGYSTSFIQHWLREILFYDFAPWVFTLAYTVFGILVFIAWLLVPPERTRN
jgi:drug/metabolite transporter superfamily protein YnfA